MSTTENEPKTISEKNSKKNLENNLENNLETGRNLQPILEPNSGATLGSINSTKDSTKPKAGFKKIFTLGFALVLVFVIGFGVYWANLTINSPKFVLFKESGSVFYKRSFDLAFQELKTTQIELPSLTSIKTQNGYGHLKLKNETIVSLSQNAELFIDTDDTSTNIRLRFGNIWNRLKPLAKNQTFEVETATSLATVRGTIFDVGYYPDQSYTSTAVVENKVSVMKKNTNGEGVDATQTEVNQNQQAFSGDGVNREGVFVDGIKEEMLKSKWYARNTEIDNEYRQNQETNLENLTFRNEELKQADKKEGLTTSPSFEKIIKDLRDEFETKKTDGFDDRSANNSNNSGGDSQNNSNSVSSKNNSQLSSSPLPSQDLGEGIDAFANFNEELFPVQTCQSFPSSYLSQIRKQLASVPEDLFAEKGLSRTEIYNAIDKIRDICAKNTNSNTKSNTSENTSNQSKSSSASSPNSTQSSQLRSSTNADEGIDVDGDDRVANSIGLENGNLTIAKTESLDQNQLANKLENSPIITTENSVQNSIQKSSQNPSQYSSQSSWVAEYQSVDSSNLQVELESQKSS